MGIDLGDVVVRRPVTMQHFAGKRVALDAWNILYQFLASIRGPDGTPLTDPQGRVTSHLTGVLHRTGALVEAGVRPVFVFDGAPHALKADTLAHRQARKVEAQAAYDAAVEAGDLATARTKAQQTSRLTVPMVEQAQRLLRALGIPVLQAPGEGEAQAAWMVQQGLADATVSQDFDALLFGTPVLVRNLGVGGRRKMPGKQVWVDVPPEEIPLAASLAALGLTREQLVDCALLVGTDFHPGVQGIGPKKAVALLQKHGSLEALLERLTANPGSAVSAVERAIVEQHEALADRDEVRRIFLEPAHAPVEAAALAMGKPDADAVRQLLVGEFGFQRERVDTALEKYVAAAGKGRQARLF
ncbi:MAG: flap endonuclease [Thermoplasmata archaeon]|jgi:flap endonuclease-1|nr:flap endonuclease [Thermoplasmata archaeon]